MSEQTLELTGTKAQNCPLALRRIGFKDFDTGIRYCFLTNHFHLAVSTKAEFKAQAFLRGLRKRCHDPTPDRPLCLFVARLS